MGWMKFASSLPISLGMDAEKEAKRRKSIAYILRRRKRGRKRGANSGEVVKSWAEYSEVNFRPSGSYMSWWQRLLWLPVVPLAILAPFAIAAGSRNAHRLAEADMPVMAWILFALLALVLVAIIGFALAYIGLSLWRSIRSHWFHKNE